MSNPEETGRRPPAPDRAGGMERMREVYGFTADPDQGPGDFVAYTVDYLFGDVWRRDGLGVGPRRLLTIGVLASQGHEDLMEVQFASALKSGELDERALREVVLHLTQYVGWALGAKANNAAERAISRAG